MVPRLFISIYLNDQILYNQYDLGLNKLRCRKDLRAKEKKRSSSDSNLSRRRSIASVLEADRNPPPTTTDTEILMTNKLTKSEMRYSNIVEPNQDLVDISILRSSDVFSQAAFLGSVTADSSTLTSESELETFVDSNQLRHLNFDRIVSNERVE